MSDYFIKIAEESDKRRQLLRDLGITVGGTALGAGTGYATTALLKSRYQPVLDRLDPNQRLQYLVPAAATVGGALSIAHLLKQNQKRREKDDKQRETSRD